jgi:hypothetical protein
VVQVQLIYPGHLEINLGTSVSDRRNGAPGIELEADVVMQYDSAKAVWHVAHSWFVRALKAGQDRELIDW